MRKQKIYSVIGMLALMLLGACSLHEEDNVFGDSSANRISEALKTYKEILTAPENGWIMQYYPSIGQSLGGYNLLVSFGADGKVNVSGEVADPEVLVTSLYSLVQSSGPMLTFDSYNEIMHLFSEPLSGLGGEFQFTIMSATPEKVILSGTKTRNMITLVPMPKEQTWANYLESVTKVQEDIFLGTFHMMVNGKEVGTVMQDYNVFTLTYSGEGASADTQKVPFIYTDGGLKLYEPLTINGVTVTNFKADVDNVSYVCTDPGVDAKFEAFFPQGYRFYEELVGTYKIADKTVRVTANPDGKTYSFAGLTDYGTVQGTYTRSMGSFSITSQYLGMALGRYFAYFCLCNDSYVTWMEGTGMTGVNSAEDPLSITFKDNGAWGSSVGDSFIVYAFNSQPPTNSNVAGYLENYPTPVVLVKQN